MKQPTPYAFFLKHAGFAWDPKIETESQGRRRCARALAFAERLGTEHGFTVEWIDDDDPDTSWMDTEDYDDDDRENARFRACIVRDENGAVLASLHGIHEDARQSTADLLAYRRVVRAELFQEAISARVDAACERLAKGIKIP